MRGLVIAALLLSTVPAIASAEDDLVACMVGKAAVVLHSQTNKDTDEALEIAYGGCGLEGATAEQEAVYANVADFVTLMVERMAAE